MGLFWKSHDKNDKAPPDFSNVHDGGSSTAAPATPEAEKQTYTVRRRDTLSKIAALEYGDPRQWRRIFEANRDVIEDPDLIFPGQILRIP